MSGRVAELTAVSGLAIVLTLAIAAPVLRAPAERIFGMAIVGRHHDPFTVMELFARRPAASVYSQPLTDLPGALLSRWVGPVAAYNWLVLLTFPFAAATAFLLARYLALPPAGAAIAAIAFAFSPFHVAHAAYHAHIAQVQWVPLYFLALWAALDDCTPAAAGFLAMSAAGLSLSNFYGGLIGAVLTPVGIGAYYFFESRGRPRGARHLALTAGTLVLVAGGAVVYAVSAAHAVVVDPSAFAFAREDLFTYSAKWWSYLVPAVESPLLGGLATRVWRDAGVHDGLLEQQVSLGWALVALDAVAVVSWLRSGRRDRSIAVVPVLAIVASAALLCSLSPERTIGVVTVMRPSGRLYDLLPMFRSYARFGVVVQLMAALLAGFGALRLWRAGTAARVMSVALLVFAAGEYAVWPPMLWRDVLPTAGHRWLMRQTGAVRALDCAPLTPETESVSWLSGSRISTQAGSFDDCGEPNLADKLAAAGYTHLIVRADTPEGRYFARRPVPEGLEETARSGDSRVYAVTAAPPQVYTVRMTAFYPREADDAWTWRWMGYRASWTIVNGSPGPVEATVDVVMTAFHGARRLTVLLDGAETQTIVVEERRRPTRIGPLLLTPGSHEMVFLPSEPPTVADTFANNGDRRPLSIALGGWAWSVAGARP